MLGAAVEVDLHDKLDNATKRDLEHARSASLSHGISSVLDRWGVAPATSIDARPDEASVPIAPRRTSRSMATPTTPPTTRKLEVIPKPKPQALSVQEPIAIVVPERRGSALLIVILALLIAGGVAIALLVL
jgi:hypothetical protein